MKKVWSKWEAFMKFLGGAITVDESSRQRREKAEAVAKAALNDMIVKRYERHMALAEIAALDNWKFMSDEEKNRG
jgi:hypothetical protein